MTIWDWMLSIPYINWVATGCSIWGFPLVLVFHTVGLALLVGTNTIIDLRVLGAGGKLPLPELRRLARPMWFGFFLSAVSGGILFMTDALHKSHQPIFYVKMGLLAVALFATYLIRPVLSENDGSAAYRAITGRTKALAAASLFLWAAVICAGRLMALATSF